MVRLRGADRRRTAVGHHAADHLFSKTSGTTCTGPSNNVVPGGFGWVADPGTCTKASVIDSILASDTGNSVPSGCSVADFQAVQNQVVLIPIFDQAGSTGSNAWYHVYKYAAFKITGYHFGGQYSTTPDLARAVTAA